MPYESPYIKVGTALSEPSGTKNRQREYGIYEMKDFALGTLYVKYDGYREGSHMYGLPAGGPDWSPPIYHRAEGPFALTDDHWAVVKYFDGRDGGFE